MSDWGYADWEAAGNEAWQNYDGGGESGYTPMDSPMDYSAYGGSDSWSMIDSYNTDITSVL